jgi:uncharacterized SAM-binding protein YcdF (DUF218 family)
VDWLIAHVLSAWLIPPGLVLLILCIALWQTWRRPPLARALVAFACVLLYVLSTPIAGDALLRAIEPAPADPVRDTRGQAIVVLGGGVHRHAPEYGGATVRDGTLARLRYGAHLHRTLKVPLLVTGGAPHGGPVTEAQAMRQVLQHDFRVPVQWVEDRSRNTLENARLSRLILEPAGVNRIYLVTHAWHMRRARLAFERAGFSVIPAPTAYASGATRDVLDFLPAANALYASSRFVHEVIGIGWYHLRIAIGG